LHASTPALPAEESAPVRAGVELISTALDGPNPSHPSWSQRATRNDPSEPWEPRTVLTIFQMLEAANRVAGPGSSGRAQQSAENARLEYCPTERNSAGGGLRRTGPARFVPRHHRFERRAPGPRPPKSSNGGPRLAPGCAAAAGPPPGAGVLKDERDVGGPLPVRGRRGGQGDLEAGQAAHPHHLIGGTLRPPGIRGVATPIVEVAAPVGPVEEDGVGVLPVRPVVHPDRQDAVVEGELVQGEVLLGDEFGERPVPHQLRRRRRAPSPVPSKAPGSRKRNR
jgi:hypothetical protein